MVQAAVAIPAGMVVLAVVAAVVIPVVVMVVLVVMTDGKTTGELSLPVTMDTLTID
jgi:hypothetical protein